MTAEFDKSPSAPGQPSGEGSEEKIHSRPLRVWLILLTIASSITCLLIGLGAAFISAISLYFLDSPDFNNQMFFTLQAALWAGTIILTAFLMVGVAGGWRAFRKNRNRLALGLSLFALLPIGLCFAGVVIAVLTSSSPFPITFSVNP